MTDQKDLEQETLSNEETTEETVTVDTSDETTVDQEVAWDTESDSASESLETTEAQTSDIANESSSTTEETTSTEWKDKNTPSEDSKKEEDNKNDQSASRSNRNKRDRRGRDDRPRRRQEGEKKEFEERMLEVRRVTRVTTWWRQLSFRATVLIWNKNGKIWLGVAKWNDVQSAVSKATHDAYKNIVNVTINNNGSVPYPTETKFKSAYIKLIPALPGTWLKAGASVRQVLELAGYTNILSKIVGTNNKLNNAILAITMLKRFKSFWHRFAPKKVVEKTEETSK